MALLTLTIGLSLIAFAFAGMAFIAERRAEEPRHLGKERVGK